MDCIKINFLSENDSKTLTEDISKFSLRVSEGLDGFLNVPIDIISQYQSFFKLLDLTCLACNNCHPESDNRDHTNMACIGELMQELSNLYRASFETYMSVTLGECKNDNSLVYQKFKYNDILKMKLYIFCQRYFNTLRIFHRGTKKILGDKLYKFIKQEDEKNGFKRNSSKNLDIYN